MQVLTVLNCPPFPAVVAEVLLPEIEKGTRKELVKFNGHLKAQPLNLLKFELFVKLQA